MEKFLEFTSIELVLAGAAMVLFVLLLLYWLITYARPLRKFKRQMVMELPVMKPPVSVIVYAKNESENLRLYLPTLLNQDYPEYEVIVVNDGSTDETDNQLKLYEQKYQNLYHTYIPEDVKYLSRKKLALTVGIKAAKYGVLLFTEANCMPKSTRWITSMASKYEESTEIILGFCAYGDHKGFMHRFIAYDNLLKGLQFISAALVRRPFSGNGRNLSYKKELFFRHKGYYKSLNLHAGDDDLFINEYANRRNTKVVYSSDSITEMARIDCFKVWKEMKVSRAATQQHYRGGRLTFYRTEEGIFFFFLLVVIASVIVGVLGNWIIAVWALLLWLLRFFIKTIILHKSAKMLLQRPSTIWLLLFEVIHPFFNIYIRVYRIFRGKNDYTFRLG